MSIIRRILSEVADARSEDEQNFIDKHAIDKMEYPYGNDEAFTGEIVGAGNSRRHADYVDGEDEDVYESVGKYKKGDKVKIKNARSYDSLAANNVSGVVDSIRTDGRVAVKVGSGTYNVDIKDLINESELESETDEEEHNDRMKRKSLELESANSFIIKAASASRKNKKKFEIGGDQYPVTIKKDISKKIAESIINSRNAEFKKLKNAPKADSIDDSSTPQSKTSPGAEYLRNRKSVAMKEELEENIKGWKNAGSDLAKMRANKGKDIMLVGLNKNGAESKMPTDKRNFRSEEEALEFHKRVRGLNPTRNIRHNLYVNGKLSRALEESVLSEAFKSGALKLKDGSSVLIKGSDAKLMNDLLDGLNTNNRKKMMDTAMEDKVGFEEILGFAREAL